MDLSNSAIPDVSWQFVVGVVIFTTALITWGRRRIMRQSINPRATIRNRVAEARQGGGAESELRELMLELEKAAREITAQIDTRYRKLELIIREADRRISELRRSGDDVCRDTMGLATGGDHRLDLLVGDEVEVSPAPIATSDGFQREADFHRVSALANRRLADSATRV